MVIVLLPNIRNKNICMTNSFDNRICYQKSSTRKKEEEEHIRYNKKSNTKNNKYKLETYLANYAT